MRTYRNRKALLIVATAAATTALPHVSRAGTTGNAVTISISGSTAMRNFTVSDGFSLLNPGSSITLNSGPGATPVTYSAAAASTGVQLAAKDALAGVTPNPLVGDPPVISGNYLGLRLEWHEQGSVEGIAELVDGQIDDLLLNNTIYNPTTGNPTWVNRNTFTAAGTITGHQLANNPSSFTTRDPQAQNRVQMAISDVTTAQGFSRAGGGALARVPGQAGYGKGNPALPAAGNLNGLGVPGARQQLQDEVVLNMSTDKTDYQTGTNYTAGPWNSAGAANTDNKTVAITATTFSANPGTGLARLNRGNAQWLQSTGRLQNGADFNVTTRDVGSGTRNVAALNVGMDPSFAVGENDDGNGQTSQANIGPGIRFSGKTAGGGLLRPTVQNARMAIGHLSLSDAQSSAQTGASRPIRVLDYRDDDNDVADGSNASYGFSDPTTGQFVHVSAANIVNGSYVIYQNETYVTAKAPNPAFAGDSPAQWAARNDSQTGIKGDNAGTDVADFRANILNSVAAFPPPLSAASPADALIANSFILPQFMQVAKARDGVNQSVANPGYNATLSGQFLAAPSLTTKFDVASATAITKGTGSSYGNTGSIAITNQNFLFGNFNQNGVRDFSAIKAAQAAQAALGTDNDFASGATPNTTKVAGLATPLASMIGSDGTTGATKGDLIVMGDFNADGKFDGKDLYVMARGAALADSTSTDQLTSASGADLGDRLRNGVLRKNAALDFMQANATPQQKLDARASVANDPTGARSFDKTDVNRDGLINRKDAQIVDFYVGKDYRNLDHQLASVIAAENGTIVDGKDINGAPAIETPTPISLVDVELTDNGLITSTLAGGTSDFKVVRDAIGAGLLNGDANFDGNVNVNDFSLLASNFGTSVDRWSKGDFNLDGLVNVNDFSLLASNFGLSATGPDGTVSAQDWANLAAAVPEPGSALVLVMGMPALMRRRRRA